MGGGEGSWEMSPFKVVGGWGWGVGGSFERPCCLILWFVKSCKNKYLGPIKLCPAHSSTV